jgi:hypothetical protein
MFPSVTEILSDEGVGFDMSHLPQEYSERGTLIHSYAESKLSHRPLPAIPDKWRGYADACDKFIAESDLEPEMLEVGLAHDLLGFKGHPDFIGKFDGSYAILDYKTGSIPEYCGAQLAAYEILAKTILTNVQEFQRIAVLLQEDGKYKLKTYDKPIDRATFMEAYHGYFERRGIKWSYR